MINNENIDDFKALKIEYILKYSMDKEDANTLILDILNELQISIENLSTIRFTSNQNSNMITNVLLHFKSSKGICTFLRY